MELNSLLRHLSTNNNDSSFLHLVNFDVLHDSTMATNTLSYFGCPTE